MKRLTIWTLMLLLSLFNSYAVMAGDDISDLISQMEISETPYLTIRETVRSTPAVKVEPDAAELERLRLMELEIQELRSRPNPIYVTSLPKITEVKRSQDPPTIPKLNKANNVIKTQTGKASWYGPGFHGRKTASGQRFNMYSLTAAHKHLPFGTRLLVTNLDNGKAVQVTVNDRGPFKPGRIVDLSKAAARQIGLIQSGVARVRIQTL